MQQEWKVYRTRFLVKALQLSEPMIFVDVFGREHRGMPGDYLVENSDGTRRLTRRDVFEDLYAEFPVACALDDGGVHPVTDESGRGLWVVQRPFRTA